MMDENGVLVCEPCWTENFRSVATKWCRECDEVICETCAESHKAVKMLRDHRIMPMEVEHEKTMNLFVSDMCKEHNKPYHFYCPEHNYFLCIKCLGCCNPGHTKCTQRVTLAEASKGSRNSKRFFALEYEIDMIYQQVLKGLKRKPKISVHEIESMIRETNANLFGKIKSLRQTLLSHVKEMLKMPLQSLENEIKSLTEMRFFISEMNDRIIRWTDSGTEKDKFGISVMRLMEQTFLTKANEVSAILNEVPKYDLKLYLNEKNISDIEEVHSIGTVILKRKGISYPMSVKTNKMFAG